MRAAIYCRLSYTQDGSEEKVDQQEHDCRQVAARIGWTVVDQHVYKDNSRSAWQRKRKRPGWDAMLGAIRTGDIDGIIVYHGDRLVRQPWDLELLLQLADERQLKLASVSGTRDLNNPDDRFILRIEAAHACRESDNTSRRILRGNAKMADKGLPKMGGKRPYGFEDDRVTVREDEAAVIREAARRLLAGQHIRGVVRWLNTNGIPTATGTQWETVLLRQILRRPRMVGDREHKGRVVKPGAWQAILDRDTWEAVRAKLANNTGTHVGGADNTAKYLLTGIARCYACSGPMRAKWVVWKTRDKPRPQIYICGNGECPKRVVRSIDHLDAYVIGRVLALLNDPEFLEQLLHQPVDSAGVGAQLTALEQRKADALSALERLVDHPEVSPEVILRNVDGFNAKIETLRGQLASTSRQRLLTSKAGMSSEQWNGEPLDVRRSIVAALYRVTILPSRRGPGFDSNTVRLERVEEA